MLVLQRKESEALVVHDTTTGRTFRICLVKAVNGKARIGIEGAGPEVEIWREEIYARRQAEGQGS